MESYLKCCIILALPLVQYGYTASHVVVLRVLVGRLFSDKCKLVCGRSSISLSDGLSAATFGSEH